MLKRILVNQKENRPVVDSVLYFRILSDKLAMISALGFTIRVWHHFKEHCTAEKSLGKVN